VAKFGPFNLIITHHADYANDTWGISCSGVFSHRLITGSCFGDAAAQAKAIFISDLEAVIANVKQLTP
jgi:hypothetical protein